MPATTKRARVLDLTSAKRPTQKPENTPAKSNSKSQQSAKTSPKHPKNNADSRRKGLTLPVQKPHQNPSLSKPVVRQDIQKKAKTGSQSGESKSFGAKSKIVSTNIESNRAVRVKSVGRSSALPQSTIAKPTTKSSNSKSSQAKVLISKSVSATVLCADGLRVRKVRAPKDLAIQYGESKKEKRVAAVQKSERKKTRRDAETRARLKDLMTPDDDLLARLARTGMIASTRAPETGDDNISAATSNGSAKRRSRSWEFRCGKCGSLSIFKTPAATCRKCGAIAVRA